MPARILLVEDNPTNLELMSYLLRAFNYPYVTASDGVEALEAARRENPDLIICDIQLPRMDGHQVVRALKAERQFQATPMIAVTALAMVGDREKVLASGFNGYIAKPIQPDTFVAQVEQFLKPGQRASGRVPPPADAKNDGRPFRQPHRGLILAADDRLENLSLAVGLLEPCGYRVITAMDPQAAFDLARRDIPDLILSDVHFPDGTGFDLLEQVLAEPSLKSIPFILISSSVPNRDERLRAVEHGVKLITRPIDSATLLAEIQARCAGGSGPGKGVEKTDGHDSGRG
jgi:two-component system cell cycle response regulator